MVLEGVQGVSCANDIADFVGKRLTSAERFDAWHNVFVPPETFKYPVDQSLKANRKTHKFNMLGF
jgi:hypothetical protein